MTRTAYNAYAGAYSLQLFNASSGQDDFAYLNVSGLSASTAYTVSAYAYVTDEFGGAALSNRGLYALDTNSAGTAQTSTITGSTGGAWVRHTVTVTMSSSPGNLQIRLYNPKGRTYWDAVQVEQAGRTAQGERARSAEGGTAEREVPAGDLRPEARRVAEAVPPPGERAVAVWGSVDPGAAEESWERSTARVRDRRAELGSMAPNSSPEA
jgi:hypothetical protein